MSPEVDSNGDGGLDGDEATKIVSRHCSQLMEHFDTVHIFCTKYNGETGTQSVAFGEGNWFARVGQMRDWMLKRDEQSRMEVRDSDGNCG